MSLLQQSSVTNKCRECMGGLIVRVSCGKCESVDKFDLFMDVPEAKDVLGMTCVNAYNQGQCDQCNEVTVPQFSVICSRCGLAIAHTASGGGDKPVLVASSGRDEGKGVSAAARRSAAFTGGRQGNAVVGRNGALGGGGASTRQLLAASADEAGAGAAGNMPRQFARAMSGAASADGRCEQQPPPEMAAVATAAAAAARQRVKVRQGKTLMRWTEAASGGYKSGANPQALLIAPVAGVVDLTCSRPSTVRRVGMQVAVYRLPHSQQLRGVRAWVRPEDGAVDDDGPVVATQLATKLAARCGDLRRLEKEGRLVAASKYQKHYRVSVRFEAEAWPVAYVVVPYLQQVGVTGPVSICAEYADEALAERSSTAWRQIRAVSRDTARSRRGGKTEKAAARLGASHVAWRDTLAAIRAGDLSDSDSMSSSDEESGDEQLRTPSSPARSPATPPPGATLTARSARSILSHGRAKAGGEPVLVPLPEPAAAQLVSEWREGADGGYGSALNPQFEVFVPSTPGVREMEVTVELKRMVPNVEDAIMVSVHRPTPGSAHGVARRVLGEANQVGQSRYVLNATVALSVSLRPSPEPYIVLCHRQTAGAPGHGPLRLSVRSLLPVFARPVAPGKRAADEKEIDCLDIIDPLRSESMRSVLVDSPIDKIAAKCRAENARFVDADFPPGPESINFEPDAADAIKTVAKWVRLSELCDAPLLFRDGIEPDDCRQGGLGNCWFVQAMASVATRPSLILDMFVPRRVLPCGAFAVRVYLPEEADWRVVVVDDYIPVNAQGLPVFSRCADLNEAWVGVLEKAYAKLHGGYQAMRGRSEQSLGVDRVLQLMTGGDALTFVIDSLSEDEIWEKVTTYLSSRWVLGCCTKDDPGAKAVGLVASHAYTVLASAKLSNGTRLLRLRNTWGHTEFTGDWSDASPLWTDEAKKGVAEFSSDADDGAFFISVADFNRYFLALYLCRITSDSFLRESHIHGRWSDRQTGGYGSSNNPQYLLSIVPDHSLGEGAAISVDLRITQLTRSAHPHAGIAVRVCHDRRRGLRHADEDLETIVESSLTTHNATGLEFNIPVNPTTGLPMLRFLLIPTFGQEPAGNPEAPFTISVRSNQKVSIARLQSRTAAAIRDVRRRTVIAQAFA